MSKTKECARLSCAGKQRGLTRWLLPLLSLLPVVAGAAIPASERAVLDAIYNRTNGKSWSSWDGIAGNECSWAGVACDEAKSHVIALRLSGQPPYYQPLYGTLPDLSGLSQLQTLDVSRNRLAGALPSLAALTNLQNLDVSYNRFSGPVPSFAGLSKLTRISVQNNQFGDALPDVSGLSNLVEFYAIANSFSGAIPPLRDAPSLQRYLVDFNNLTGPVPDLNALGELRTFTASANQISGDVPDVSGAAKLNLLDLSQNQLNGSIPTLRSSELAVLFLDHNQLGGVLPDLSSLGKLAQLDVTRNRLSGKLPSLAAASKLELFKVGDNQFNGDPPVPPNPAAIVSGSATLCVNALNHVASSFWDTATFSTPWYRGCDKRSVNVNVSTTPANPLPFQPYSIDVVVTPLDGGDGAPSGTVFLLFNNNTCNIQLNNGVGHCSISAANNTNFGKITMRLQYSGDTNFNLALSLAQFSIAYPTSPLVWLEVGAYPQIESNAPVYVASYGQPIGFSASISGNNHGAGTMEFTRNAQTVCSGVPVQGGGDNPTALCNADVLTPGAHSLTAMFRGADGNSYTSASRDLRVMKATPTLQLNTSSASILAGQSVVITTSLTTPPGTVAPTGTIKLTAGSQGCVITLPAVSCSFTPDAAQQSTVYIDAQYSGDNNYEIARSGIGINVSSVKLSSYATSPSLPGTEISFIAAISANTPSGTVTFYDGAQILCDSVPLSGSGNYTQAECKAKLAIGDHNLTAVYSGDANNSRMTSAALPWSVKKGETKLVLNVNPNPVKLGNPVTATVNLQDTRGYSLSSPINGTITISDTAVRCTTKLAGYASPLSCSLTPSTIGSFTIGANYTGDDRYASSDASATITVNASAAESTVVLATQPTTVSFGDYAYLTATVSGSSPTGTITMYEGAVSLCQANVYSNSGTTGSCSINTLAIGTHSIIAKYSGDANNLPSVSTPTSLTIGKAKPNFSINLTPPQTTLGNSVSVTVAYYGSNVQLPTGSLTISDGSSACTVQLTVINSIINGGCSLTPQSVGTKTITVTYPGDANYNASAQTFNFGVAGATRGVALATSANPVYLPQTPTLTATVFGSAPGGTVTFKDAGTLLCNAVTLAGSGDSRTATCQPSALATGAHPITAAYSGDANNAASTSSTISSSVVGATSVTLASSKNPSVFAESVVFTATFNGGGNSAWISIRDGNTEICSVYTNNNSNGSCTVSFRTLGAHNIMANFFGDNYRLPSVSAPLVQTVNAGPQVNMNQQALSGAWYNPATSGQGFYFKVFQDLSGPDHGYLSAGWFTFDTTGGDGPDKLRWYTLNGDVASSDATGMLTISTATGGNFSAGPKVGGYAVGTAMIKFLDCTTATLSYTFSDGSNRSGTIPLTRLTANPGCKAEGSVAPQSTFSLSDAWYDPATSGQGMYLDVNAGSSVFAGAWFTYAQNGSAISGPASQRWYTLQSNYYGGAVANSVQIYTATGGVFDSGSPVKGNVVGSASVQFVDCNHATISYSFSGGENAGATGTLKLTRIIPMTTACGM